MIAEGLHHSGVHSVQGSGIRVGPCPPQGAGPDHQIPLRVAGLPGKQQFCIVYQLLRVGKVTVGTQPDDVHIIPVFIGAGSGNLGALGHGNRLPRLRPGELISGLTPALIAGKGDLAHHAIDGHRVYSHAARGQRSHVLPLRGFELNVHRLHVSGNLKIFAHHIGSHTAAAQNGGTVLLARTHVDHGDGDSVAVPVQTGVILSIFHGGGKVVNIAQVGIDVLLQGAGVGHIAGGTGGQAVAPADDAGQVLRNGLHILLIGLGNGL